MLTNHVFEKSLRVVSGGGKLQFLEKQLYYQVCREIYGLTGRLGAFVTRKRPPPIPYEVFHKNLLQWTARRGEIPGLIRALTFADRPGRTERDIRGYAPDYLIVTDDEYAELLYRNDFHFTARAAILSPAGYPRGRYEHFLDQARDHPDVPLFFLHDASPAGCTMKLRLRERWFGRDADKHPCIDLGLRPNDFFEKRSRFFITSDSPTPGDASLEYALDASTLSDPELEWLRGGNRIELSNLPTARLLILTARALHRFNRPPAARAKKNS